MFLTKALLSTASLVLAAAAAPAAFPSTAMAASAPAAVAASVSGVSPLPVCGRNGDYAWNAIVYGTRNTQYQVTASLSYVTQSGGGGWTNPQYVGVMSTGSGGSGTTSTYYGDFREALRSITVFVTVGGVTGQKTVNCS